MDAQRSSRRAFWWLGSLVSILLIGWFTLELYSRAVTRGVGRIAASIHGTARDLNVRDVTIVEEVPIVVGNDTIGRVGAAVEIGHPGREQDEQLLFATAIDTSLIRRIAGVRSRPGERPAALEGFTDPALMREGTIIAHLWFVTTDVVVPVIVVAGAD
jgi:hypothetical protein